MSRYFNYLSSQYLETDVAAVLAAPLTISIWFKTISASADQSLVYITDKDVSNQAIFMRCAGGTSGDPVTAECYDGIGYHSATTTVGYTINTWHHALGLFTSSSDRRVWIDNKGEGSNTDTSAPSVLDRTSIGRSGDSSPGYYMRGWLGEVCIWDVALNAYERRQLAHGEAPWLIRPAHIAGFWLPAGYKSDKDFSGRGIHMTPVNGPTWDIDPHRITNPFRGNPWHVGRRTLDTEHWRNSILSLPYGMAPTAPAGQDSITPLYGEIRRRRSPLIRM